MPKHTFSALLTFVILFIASATFGQQKIKDGTVTSGSLPDPNAIIELESSNKGLLLPRVALTATNIWGLASGTTHIAGMTVYNTATNGTGATAVTPGYYYNDGEKWVRLADAGNFWSVVGNEGTNSGDNFLGTTDNASLSVRTNSLERMVVDSVGNVGISTRKSDARLRVGDASLSAIPFPLLTSNVIFADSINDFPDPSAINCFITNLGILNATTNHNQINGGVNGVVLQGSADINTLNGAANAVLNFNTGTLGFPTGVQGIILNFNSGTIQEAAAVSGDVNNFASGTIETAIGVRTGQVQGNTAIGLEITSNVSGTVDEYAIKSDDDARSHFNGNIGIKTQNNNEATNALHINDINPLRLEGLQSGSETDSVLTVDATGVVRMRDPQSLVNTDNFWSINGNAGTNDSVNFLGTTDGAALNFRIYNEKAGRLEGNNTSLGYHSAMSNNGGHNLTALGANALAANTTGFENTAVGADALALNTEGVFNTAVGRGALGSNTTGTQNTAVGRQALSSNTTASYNTAIGMYALSANTTGEQNTTTGAYSLIENTTGYSNNAYGMNALRANTTGFSNTSIGSGTLYNNTTGYGNVAIGNGALESNTEARYNTAVGLNAMQWNTTGANNTAIGQSALANNTTGNQNLALGLGALFSNTTGGSNTALGYNALQGNTTGFYNVSIGEYNMRFNTSGNNNVSLGVFTLDSNVTGTNNLALGNFAGRGLVSGDNNIFIGTNVQPNISTSASNQLNIGNWIYGSNGNIGIGNPAPAAKLHVVKSVSDLTPAIIEGCPEYTDNSAAITAGLPVGALYRSGDILKVVH